MTHFKKLCSMTLALALVLTGAPGGGLRVAAAAADEEAGSDKGRFSVTSSGSATYNIKIEIPPGIKGYEPSLSFGYNSTSQNGLLGVGWNLNGFSKITRVRKIIAIDGVDGDITYTSADRFALNGKRLLVMTGAYGAPGSVYRTEIDNWDQVVASDSAGSGPQSFTVRQPNGEILVFGGTQDSRVPVSTGDGTVREWLLSSQTDRNGNLISYSYSLDPMNSGQPGTQVYPVEISYGANTATSPATAANRSISMAYEVRPDPIRNFVGGGKAETTLRLGAVSAFLASDLVSNYRLAYESSPSTGLSRLTSVQRFASDDVNATGLSPSRFTYQDSNNAFGGSQSWLQGTFTAANGWDATDNPVMLADVNGDGLVDIVGFKNGVQVSLAKPGGYAPTTTWLQDFSPEYNWSGDEPRYLTDINGDGLADIVGFSNDGVEFALADAATSTFVKSPGTFSYFAPNSGWTAGAPRYLADVNGDGAADIVGFNDGIEVALALASGGFETPTTWFSDFGVKQGWQGSNVLLADVNGDGKSDAIAMNQQTRSVNVALSTGSGFSQTGWDQSYAYFADSSVWDADTPRMMSDVNGDGLSDIIGFSTQVTVGLSNGAGFEAPETWSTGFNAPDWTKDTPRMMSDVNGDGRADVIGFNDGGVAIALSNGSAFVAGNWNQGSLNGLGLAQGGSASQTNRLVADINADGLLDVLAFTPNAVQVGLSDGVFPDLMTGIERSSMGTVDITYKPISDPVVYSETVGQGALAKLQRYRPMTQNPTLPQYRSSSNLTGRFYVVSQAVNANNPAITSAPYSYGVTHFYKDGQVSNTGRGWLGFASSSHTNSSIGRTTTVAYNQAFPLIGRPSARSVACSISATNVCSVGDIVSVDNLDYIAVATEVSSVTGYQATMVRPSSERTDKYQAGAYRHSIGQTYQYDTYGNRTQSAKLNLVTQSGADINPADNVYSNTAYQNDPANWRYGFRQFVKTSANPSLTNLGAFTAGQDLELHQWTYDAAMNVKSSGIWDDALQAFLTTQYAYDAFGNQVSLTAPSGTTTASTIEQTFNTYLQTRSQPPGNEATPLITQFGYDARFGKQSFRMDANGNQFATCFDSFGRRQSIQAPAPDGTDPSALSDTCLSPYITAPQTARPAKLATVSRFSHAWIGGVPAVTRTNLTQWPQQGEDPSTQSVAYLYDGLERQFRMVTEASQGGQLSRVAKDLTFNAANQTLTSALPYVEGSDSILYETTTYDPLDRANATTTPWLSAGSVENVSSQTSYSTTQTGQSITRVLAAGTPYQATRSQSLAYYANRRKVETQTFQDERTSKAPLVETSYERDILGRITSVAPPADAGSTTATYAYDSVGRISKQTLPALGETTFDYGTDGRLAKKNQANGAVSFTYDGLGRRTAVSYPGGLALQFAYDSTAAANGLGRLGSAQVTGQEFDVTRTFAYDPYGSIVENTLALGSPVQTFSERSQYDPLARPVQTTLPDGTTLGFTYDLERVASQSVNGVTKVSFSDFTAIGQPQTINYANGVTTTLVYTPDFNVSKLTTVAGSTQLLSETYQLDPYGFPLQVAGSSAKWSNYTRTATFDTARLAMLNDTRLNGPESFEYDNAGNLTTSPDLALASNGYLLSQASTINGQALNPSYDKMGNLLSATAPNLTFTSTYDGRNRLASFAPGTGAATAKFAYDHRGVRVWRSDLQGAEHFYLSPLFRQTTDAGRSVGETVLHGGLGPTYSHLADGKTVTETYLHPDARQSLTFTSDGSGTAMDWFLYNAYGTPIERTENAPDYGFMGQPYDADTGLYYFNQRYYQPSLARFTRPDTLYSASIYRHDSANRYAFMLNNPSWGFDPSGHGLPACIIGLGGGFFGTVAGVAQTIDGSLQKNKLSAIGVGGATIIGGLFAAGAGTSACLKLWRGRVANQQAGNGDGGNDGGGNDGNNGLDGADGGNGDGIPLQQVQPVQPVQPIQGSQDGVGGNQDNALDGSDDESQSSNPSSSSSDDSGSQADDGEGSSSDANIDGGGSSQSQSIATSSEGSSNAVGDAEFGASPGSRLELPSVVTGSQSGSSDGAVSTSTSVVNGTEGESGGLEASLSASTGAEVSESAATTTGVVTEASTEAVVTAGSETAVLGEVLPDLLLLILAF